MQSDDVLCLNENYHTVPNLFLNLEFVCLATPFPKKEILTFRNVLEESGAI